VESSVSRLDPRWKLAALILAGAAVVALHSLPTAALACMGAAALAILARLPPRWCLARIGIVLLFLAPFMILLPFVQHDPEPAVALAPLHMSLAGMRIALVLALKTVSLLLLVLVLLATAPLPTTFKAAQALRVPGLLLQLAGLTYRYLYGLAGELARVRVALRVRGYRNRATLHCYRTVGHVAGALLVRGYEQAERVEQAMRCRGFDGHFRTLSDFQTQPRDVLAFIVIVGLAAALIIVEIVGSP
jgi:cobalt/nickel transport system permease protein